MNKRKRRSSRHHSTIVHPPGISPESSIVLDVRLGASSRPMHFPLLCTIRDVVEIIRPVFPNSVSSRAGLYLPRSGIWMKSRSYLYSYYLDRLVIIYINSGFVILNLIG